MRYFVGFVFFLITSVSYATACFTPQQYCEGQILDLIYSAKKSIRVQSYTFTSYKIAHALANMHKRGVDVQVIMDKSQFQCQYFSQRNYLIEHGIPVFEDYKPAIAHSKVIIVDDQTVETGSFNYTKAAQKNNAENVLILQDKKLAQVYLLNWQNRKSESEPILTVKCTSDVMNKPIPS